MQSITKLYSIPRAHPAIAEPQPATWVRRLGWQFPLFVILGFLATLGLLALLSVIQLRWELAVLVLAPAGLLIVVLGLRQAWSRVGVMRRKLVWWHWLWLLAFVSALVFRIRDATEAASAPIDGFAMLRVLPEAIIGLVLLVRLLHRGSSWWKSSWRGLVGALSIYGLVCLVSALWSVKPTWTLYKSAEYLLDVTVLSAVLTTVRSPEAYESLFNWTLTLCGIELLWTWIGVLIWPAEALGTYPGRLVGVFPIQSANAIGASGAILAVVAISRLLPMARCRFDRSWNALLFLFGVASMIAAQTRSAMAGFLLGVLLVLVFSQRARIAALLGIAASALLALTSYTVSLIFNPGASSNAWLDSMVGPSGAVWSFLQRGQSQEQLESLTGRIGWWQFAWQQFLTHPWTGLGAYAGGKFAVLSRLGFGDTAQLHSDYLETLVGTSFWGLAPILIALFGTWWLLFRFVRNRSLRPFERQLAVEAMGVLGVITIRSFFNAELVWHAPQFFLVVLGYAELLRRSAKQGTLQTATAHPRKGPLNTWRSQAATDEAEPLF